LIRPVLGLRPHPQPGKQVRRLVYVIPAGFGGGELGGVRLDLSLRPGKQLV